MENGKIGLSGYSRSGDISPYSSGAGVQSHSPPQPSDALPARRRPPPFFLLAVAVEYDREPHTRDLTVVEIEDDVVVVGGRVQLEVGDLVL